jgi:acetyltransferase-like isoleucine patch superfamily enzyme
MPEDAAHQGTISEPEGRPLANIVVDPTALLDVTSGLELFRSEAPVGMMLGRATNGLGMILDVGPRGRVILGDFVGAVGVRIVCDAAVEIGDFTIMGWDVVIMDTYRLPFDPIARRRELQLAPRRRPRRIEAATVAQPIRIGRGAWLGFGVCVLPGVTIGDACIIGARSVVITDVPAYTLAGGNPARVIRHLPPEEIDRFKRALVEPPI